MNVVFLKFDEYKTEFINSYENTDYELYDSVCYKLYMLYMENIIINMNINTETQIKEMEDLYGFLVRRHSSESFYNYVDYHKSSKPTKQTWEWFVMNDFTIFNMICSDVAKIVMSTYGLSDLSKQNIELFDFRDLHKQQSIVYYSSKIIPSNQSYYWNN